MANALVRLGERTLSWLQKAPVPAMRPSDIVGSNPGWGFGTGGWWPVIREPFAGAWQRNMEIRADSVLSNVTNFRCVSLISTDIAKMRMKLIRQTAPDVWEEDSNPAWSPVIRQPNHYQNRIQFYSNWLESKLNSGNTYVLKQRDQRQVVTALYVLDPRRVRPLVADNGEVFYELNSDTLGKVAEQVVVPASEIIHDRWNCFFHPLVGLSPIFANALPSMQGLRIAEHSTQFFTNGANPGGILTGEHRIDDDTAERFRTRWRQLFGGPNVGNIAVLGNGLKFEKIGVTALDSQLIEQQKWTAEMICSSYGMPTYKVQVAPAPTLNNIEALQRQYYQDCLQIHVESVELCVDEGLGLPADWGVEFDLDGLFRMDTATQVTALKDAVGAGILKPNEARKRLGYGNVQGGDTPYLQQQNYSLAALDKRDQQDDPFATGSGRGGGAAGPPPATPPPSDDEPRPPDDTQENSVDSIELLVALQTKFAGALDHAA